MKTRYAILAAATVSAGLLLPAGSAAACDAVWEGTTGFCNSCHFESWAYHTADDTAFDALPDVAWRCAP